MKLVERLMTLAGLTKPVVTAVSEPPAQRRGATRMPCNHPVECVSGGKKFSAVIRDISMTGTRLEIPKVLPHGADLLIRCPMGEATTQYTHKLEIDTVQARVVWCRKSPATGLTEAGVVHSDDLETIERTWVYYLLRKLGLGSSNVKERRKHPRLPYPIAGRLGPAGTVGVPGMVLNLGEAGCLYEGTTGAREGAPIQVTVGPLGDLPLLALDGRVIYSRKQGDTAVWRVGIQFSALPNKLHLRLRRYLVAMLTLGP